MKRLLTYFFITVILSVTATRAQTSADSEYILDNGCENYVENGAEFCADYITVNAGASYITDVETGTCSGAVIGGDGYIELPVELISFTAIVKGSEIHLNWTTATETNNFGFEVERKKVTQFDGNPHGTWESIEFIEGAGTTAEEQNYSFIDKELSSATYFYRLKQIDLDGTYEYLPEIEVEYETELPDKFELYQNYPNPFSKGAGGNPNTTIKYSIAQSTEIQNVTLKIFNILGVEVAMLVNEPQTPGRYEIIWNAENIPSGVYFYSLQVGNFYAVKKMNLIK